MSDKIFITGATGFVGSHLARRFIKEGEEVHILSRQDSKTWRISDILGMVYRHDADITETEKIKETGDKIRPTYIVHCANAGVYGGVSVSDEELVRVNLLGLISLLSASDSIPYKGFINVGSSSEYGLKSRPMKENDLCEPVNTYGVSKLAATLYASFIARSREKPIITLRLFSPFGPYDDYRRLISRVILDALAGREPQLANPDAVRDYVFIEDVIDLFSRARYGADEHKGGVFNVGSGKQHKISDVVSLILGYINPELVSRFGVSSSQSWEPNRWEADINKTTSCFSWRPKYLLKEGIKMTIDWFKNNKELYLG